VKKASTVSLRKQESAMSDMQSHYKPLRWLWVALIIVVLDFVSKQWISGHFVLGERLAVLPFFNLTLAHNTGAAFSFLHDAGGWQRWAFTGLAVVVSVALAVWLSRLDASQKLLAIALTLVMAGAVGNMIDRMMLGYVVDFVQIYWNDWYFPAFNVADSAISVGAVFLIVDAFMHPETDK
jgi:signal peptidase II